MSNQINIQRTIFKNYGSETESYGYRIWDSYAADYNNSLEKEFLDFSDEQFINLVFDDCQTEITSSIFNFMTENHNGISIDDEFYDWDWVKKALDL